MEITQRFLVICWFCLVFEVKKNDLWQAWVQVHSMAVKSRFLDLRSLLKY